jgi:hypothetical protein
VPQHKIKSGLTYDQTTGIFKHKRSASNPRPSLVAGSKNSFGYIRITIGPNIYAAHRLAWIYVYGTQPKGDITHLNGDKSDNRIDNLMDTAFTDVFGHKEKELANHG